MTAKMSCRWKYVRFLSVSFRELTPKYWGKKHGQMTTVVAFKVVKVNAMIGLSEISQC